MANVLEQVDRQFQHASRRVVRSVVLDFPVIPAISNACAQTFAALDREDEAQRRIARQAWIVKTTILQTLLAFDDPRLELAQLAAGMRTAAETLPSIAAQARALAHVIDALVATPLNPKREWFLKFVNGGGDRPAPSTAVFAALQGARSPGWPALSSAEEFGADLVALIRYRRDLRSGVFDRGVITGTLKFAARPVVHDLLYGGLVRELIVLSYRDERVQIPQPIALPQSTVFHRATPPAIREAEVGFRESEGAPTESPLDVWANESFWQEIRLRQGDVAPVSEGDVAVGARFVLFADGSGTFLPNDKGVVEISELLDGNGRDVPAGDQLPRKPVLDLEEGDLVMLRLGGGGHYVEDVADDLMNRSGLGTLRNDATEWKHALTRAMKQHGEGVVARIGRELGLRLRSPGYLWSWAGDAVMAPHDFDTFRTLIATVVRLDAASSNLDVDRYAAEKWQQTELVKGFHTRAGAAIRAALLQRVRELLAQRRKVETVEAIELPGVKAGRMGLLRVSAVDTKPMQVALSRLYQVMPLKEN